MKQLYTMKSFVNATPSDTDSLRILARQSEAFWGYNNTFLDTFDSTFNITSSFIRQNPVYLLREHAIPLAFWGLKPTGGRWELEYFYVAVQALGNGYGKCMWNHMTSWCQNHQTGPIQFVTSPQAAGFYEKMGAVQDGTVPSSIDGRMIPHFVYDISEFSHSTYKQKEIPL